MPAAQPVMPVLMKSDGRPHRLSLRLQRTGRSNSLKTQGTQDLTAGFGEIPLPFDRLRAGRGRVYVRGEARFAVFSFGI